MREIEIDIDKKPSRKSLFSKLKAVKPRAGDHVKLVHSEETTFAIIIALIVVYLYFKTQGMLRSFGEQIIDDLFGKYDSADELEKDIENEYGIKVTVEPKEDPEREDWVRFSSTQLERAYTDSEDDYSDVPVKEPNPDYIPWKKGTSSE